MTFHPPLNCITVLLRSVILSNFYFKMLNKRHVYDTFQRKLDNDIFVLRNEMCFYLTMLNIHANLQHTFLLLSEKHIL